MTQKNRSQSQKKADRDAVFHPEFREDLRYWVETDRKSTQAKLIQEHPDEKPPWGDGDLFTSLFEGAQSFRLGRPTVLGNRAEVPVHLAYVEGGSTTRWSDVLVLVRARNRWLVWDILSQITS